MPYQFEFDSKNRILRVRFEKQATDEDLKEYYRVAREQAPRIDPQACILDFSAVTSFEVSSEMIHEMAHSAPAMPDPMRPRFVVAFTPHIFGMARMLQVEAEQTRPNMDVVQKLREACAILGIQRLKFKPLRPERAKFPHSPQQ